MPQFQFANETVVWAQLAWLTIFFAILYFGIVQATLPKLGRTITARENKVSGDIDAAARAKHDADVMAERYAAGIDQAHASARTAVDAAKAKAAVEVEAALKQAGVLIGEKAAAADAALSGARSRAMGEIEAVAADAVGDIVERITGRRPDASLSLTAAQSALAG